MTTKEQYRLALSAIRFTRSYSRELASGQFPKAIHISVVREILHGSIDRHIFDAAVKTIIQMKYDNAPTARWTMSFRCNHWNDQIPF